MKSNLDVWAIQFYPDEVYSALSQITNGVSIIYSNCYFNFKIGDVVINNREFDTFLYNEESGILIMLMSGGVATKQNMIDYLEEHNLQYGEVVFNKPQTEIKDSSNIPELWFAREQYVLDDALDDSINNGCTECIYYPYMEGSLEFSYHDNKNNISQEVDGRLLRGVLRLGDKMILIIHQKDNMDELGNSRNIKFSNVTDALIKRNIKYKMYSTNNPFYPPIKDNSFSMKKR